VRTGARSPRPGDSPRPRVTLELEALPGASPPVVRLRMALKALLRSFGFRALSVPQFDAEEFSAMRAVTTKPSRRLTLRIAIGADTHPAMIRALDDLRHYLVTGGRGPKAEGGPYAGSSMTLVEDPAMTHSKYWQLFRAWEEAQPAAKAA